VSAIRSTGSHGGICVEITFHHPATGADLRAIGDEPERADRFRVLAEADAAEPA
jgi:hypothetical protein